MPLAQDFLAAGCEENKQQTEHKHGRPLHDSVPFACVREPHER